MVGKLSVITGEQATLKVSVYGSVYAVNLLDENLKVKISGYTLSLNGSIGKLGGQDLLDAGYTIVDIQFSNGVVSVKDSLMELEVDVVPSEPLKVAFISKCNIFSPIEKLLKPYRVVIVTNSLVGLIILKGNEMEKEINKSREVAFLQEGYSKLIDLKIAKSTDGKLVKVNFPSTLNPFITNFALKM